MTLEELIRSKSIWRLELREMLYVNREEPLYQLEARIVDLFKERINFLDAELNKLGWFEPNVRKDLLNEIL